MKAAFVAFLLTALTSVSAQTPFGALPASCGPKDASFNVRLDKSKHSVIQPGPGKALIYFIRDPVRFNLQPASLGDLQPTLLGIDGAWVGAIRENSYFSVAVDPAEHHICAAAWYSREEKLVEVAHLQAEAGKMYFYRMGHLEHGPIDSDAGSYMIPALPLSVSRSKK